MTDTDTVAQEAAAIVEAGRVPEERALAELGSPQAPPTRHDINLYVAIANQVAQTDFVPRGMRGHPMAVVASILSGREYGLGPMESLRQVYIVDGSPRPSAKLLTALVEKAGHEIEIEVYERERVRVVGRRLRLDGTIKEFAVEWTKEDAQSVIASQKNNTTLWDKDNWQGVYARRMLYNRAVTELTDVFFADCVMGLGYARRALPEDDWVGPAAPAALPKATDDDSDVVMEGEVVDEAPEDESAEPAADRQATVDSPVFATLVHHFATYPKGEKMDVVEAWLRTLYSLMEAVGIWLPSDKGEDRLHADLRRVGAQHMADLRKSQLDDFAEAARQRAWLTIDELLRPDVDIEATADGNYKQSLIRAVQTLCGGDLGTAMELIGERIPLDQPVTETDAKITYARIRSQQERPFA